MACQSSNDISKKRRRRKKRPKKSNIIFNSIDYIHEKKYELNDESNISNVQITTNNSKRNRRNFKKTKKQNDIKSNSIKHLKCKICLTSKLSISFIQLTNCKHIVCNDCLYDYVKANLKDISKYPMKCFHYDCDQLLHSKDVQKAFKDRKIIKHKHKHKKKNTRLLYRNDNESINMFDKFSILCAIPTSQTIECPKCKMLYFMGHNNAEFGDCDDCNYRFCLTCNRKWHPGQLCPTKTNSQNDVFAERENEKLFRQQKWMMCPECGIMVEKTYGCNAITHYNCPKAKRKRHKDIKFCYLCGQKLTSERYDINGQLHFPGGSSYNCVNGMTKTKKTKLCTNRFLLVGMLFVLIGIIYVGYTFPIYSRHGFGAESNEKPTQIDYFHAPLLYQDHNILYLNAGVTELIECIINNDYNYANSFEKQQALMHSDEFRDDLKFGRYIVHSHELWDDSTLCQTLKIMNQTWGENVIVFAFEKKIPKEWYYLPYQLIYDAYLSQYSELLDGANVGNLSVKNEIFKSIPKTGRCSSDAKFRLFHC